MTLAAFFAWAGSAHVSPSSPDRASDDVVVHMQVPEDHAHGASCPRRLLRQAEWNLELVPSGISPVGLSWPAGMIAGMVCVLAIAENDDLAWPHRDGGLLAMGQLRHQVLGGGSHLGNERAARIV